MLILIFSDDHSRAGLESLDTILILAFILCNFAIPDVAFSSID